MTTERPPTSAPQTGRRRSWRAATLHRVLGAALTAGLAAGALTFVLGAPGSAPISPSSLMSSTVPSPGVPSTWMLSVGALQRLEQAGHPSNLLASFFGKPTTILIGAAGHGGNRVAPKASAAADFASAAALVQALKGGRIPASAPNVVLDLEAWPLTPLAEQRDPIAAAKEAARAAKAAGKRLIFTPGVDLVRTLTGHRLHGGALSAAYDRLLAGPGAALTDVFEIQAQGTEGTPEAASFTSAALQAARAARPGIPVLVGLSTNPSGRRVTPQDLLQLARVALRAGANGFWLNVPEAGRACPRCGTAQPQVAISFLEQLARAASPSPVHPVAPITEGTRPASEAGLHDAAGHLLAAGGRPSDWILAASQFAAVVGQPAVARVMGGGTVYEPVSARQEPSTLLPVTPTLVVHSEALLAQMVAQHRVRSDIRAVLYDNERFPDTPAAEQRDPLAYDRQVARLATAKHWVSICDLIEPDRLPATKRVPVQEVPSCTVVGLNTVQQSERQPTKYAALVARAVNIVHEVRPTATVLAGLSANPRGGPVTAAEIAADIRATHTFVQGYWLNVPSPGVGCPGCGRPDPGLMANALGQLAGSTGQPHRDPAVLG